MDRAGEDAVKPAGIPYDKLVLRNDAFISPSLQDKIRATRILVAGCGLGSVITEAAVRIGYEKFILADGDTVEAHNLNRQIYVANNVGMFKVDALADRIGAINPSAQIVRVNTWITEANVADLVARSEMIFDTVDFLDLPAITSLHDEAHRQGKPIISAFAAGWGAVAIYFPPTKSKNALFRDLFGLPPTGSVKGASYVDYFAPLIKKLAPHLDPTVTKALSVVFKKMKDGSPCPGSQVSAGSFSVAGLAITMAARILNGDKITSAPEFVIVNIAEACASAGIRLNGVLSP